jgi:hypothetical protein
MLRALTIGLTYFGDLPRHFGQNRDTAGHVRSRLNSHVAAIVSCGGLVRIELNCADCGGNRFSLDHGNSDGSLIICEDCGHKVGTLGKLKQMVAEEVLRRTSGGEPEELRN